MSDLFLTNLQRQNAAVADLIRQERPAAAITLTRSTTLVLTSGITIPWDTKVRGQGITWSGTNVTIPTSGYYFFSIQLGFTVYTQVQYTLTINGTIDVVVMATHYRADLLQTGQCMRYMTTGDTVAVRAYFSTATAQVTAEGATNSSPYFHVVQMTSVVV